MEQDEVFMREALAEAGKALRAGEVPVGAVVVLDGKVIARACNSPVSKHDPTAHAEILALRKAGREAGNYRLTDAVMFVTLEPCIMCAGAIVHARIRRLVFGAEDPKGGGCISLYGIPGDVRLNHSVELRGGVLKDECAEILSGFFKKKRLTSVRPDN
ncbi:MAG: tRNA adenosine(34) deaminase TadA [Syntrophales bacterium]|nr:tRNA adenosine(34) deaminase TadA [Syntrophales bacterium]MDD5233693.1 tRNA adenosine(34) deaminase TadA [Syntrophales bacterium]MDD5533921.1 tRNA adenosine(34) deaminase TadA [Syntrophales bacterium]HPL63539.1 tRNA adenosine(34) deaminase TadA [Syntrophales bacterium]